MASSLAEYYGRAKSGFGNIESAEMAQLGEDWLVTAATGAGIGMLSAALGGLDHEIAGFPVPLDGLVSVGLGYAGLSMGGETGEMLKIASIAAGGSAAVRTFEKFFEKGFGTKVKGEFEELGHSGFAQRNLLPGFGFGQSAQDRLVEAAKYL
jgi:hypothetical protein